MKILMIQPVNFSGVFYCTAYLAHELTKHGVDLKVVTCTKYEREPVEWLKFALLPIMWGMNRQETRFVRAIKYALSQVRVWLLIFRWRPDVIHFTDIFIPVVDGMTLCVAKIFRIPVVLTVHDVQYSTLTSRKTSFNHHRFILSFLYRSADRLVTHSNGSREELSKEFGIGSERMAHSRLGGVPFQKELGRHINDLEARDLLKIDRREKVMLFFGNLKRAKGLEYIVQALPLLIEKIGPVRLLVVGPARSEAENDFDYERLIDDCGVREYITFRKEFVGADQVHVYFKACDLVVLPYTKVYQSAVVPQAFTFSKPVVASNIDGLKDIVIDHETGFLFESRDIGGLAATVQYVFENPDRAAAVAANAERLMQSTHSWETIAKINFSVYEELSNLRNKGRA